MSISELRIIKTRLTDLEIKYARVLQHLGQLEESILPRLEALENELTEERKTEPDTKDEENGNGNRNATTRNPSTWKTKTDDGSGASSPARRSRK